MSDLELTFLSWATIAFGTLLIAWAYITQYRSGPVWRTIMVLTHGLSIVAIITPYTMLAWRLRSDAPNFYIGAAIFLAGSALFWHSAFVHKASLLPQDNYALFSEGAYTKIRHPIYSGGLLGAAGLLIAAPSWQVASSWAVLFLSMWVLMVIEEYELTVRYGDCYAVYCEKTKRLIPAVV